MNGGDKPICFAFELRARRDFASFVFLGQSIDLGFQGWMSTSFIPSYRGWLWGRKFEVAVLLGCF